MCFVPVVRYTCGHFSTINKAPYVVHTRLCSLFARTGDCPGTQQDSDAGFLQHPLRCDRCAKRIERRWRNLMWQKTHHYTVTMPREQTRSPYLLNLVVQAASQAYQELLDRYSQAIDDCAVPWRFQMDAQMARATEGVPDFDREWEDLPAFDYDVYQRRVEWIRADVAKVVACVGALEQGDIGGLVERFETAGVSREIYMGFLVNNVADILEGRSYGQGATNGQE